MGAPGPDGTRTAGLKPVPGPPLALSRSLSLAGTAGSGCWEEDRLVTGQRTFWRKRDVIFSLKGAQL